MTARAGRSRVVALLLALSALGLSARGDAEDAPADVAAARELFKEGSRLAQEGKWDQARQRFEQSLGLRRAAITLYSLGVAQQKSGRFVEALENLRAFLHWPPNEATDPYVPIARDAVKELEGAVGRVVLDIRPKAALTELRVDGVSHGDFALGTPRIVNPGKHTVTVVAASGARAEAEVTVERGATVTAVLELRAGAEPIVAPAAASSAPTREPAAPPPETTTPRDRTVPAALLIGGGALLVTGGVFGAIALSRAKAAPTREGPNADAARRDALFSDVFSGVGIVAGGIGAYLWLSTPASPTPVGAWIGPRGVGIDGRF